MQRVIVLIGSHSLSYAYDSLYGAYLKSHYPLEYYTVALNFYRGDFERTNGLTNELSYFNLSLSSPRFRYSTNDYSCDKSTNTIYKGTASIKGLSKTVGNILYSLKDKQYSTFLDFLIDAKENKVGFADILTLIKLNYFEEFGTIKKLLTFMELYDKLYGKKMLKKDKDYGVKQMVLKEYCAKETEKQITGFDSEKCLRFLYEKLPNDEISIYEKCKYELDYFGYVASKDSSSDNSLWIVLDEECRGKSKNHMVSLQNLNNGEKISCKVKNNIFVENPFKKGNLLFITGFSKEGVWIFPTDGGKPQQSSTKFENILRKYSVKE